MRRMDISGFVTVKDAAELISLTNKRVYQLIDEKKLDAVQLGREYLVKVKSVEKYLRDRNGKRPAKNGNKRKR